MDCLLQATTTLTKYCSLNTLGDWQCLTTSSPFYFCNYSLSTDFERIPSLVYVIGGLVLFASILLFIDFLRRTIR